jgi:hypothetical protein
MPGAYAALLAKYETAGITTSVIGLGTKADSDAKLLEDIAKLGKGNIMFTADAEELPRLFTEDTMSVARSSFIKKEGAEQEAGIPGKMLADARLMGDLPAQVFPRTDGYNLSYLKTNATLGAVSQDQYAAPWSAFWYRGLGRVAALTLEVDGQYSGAFGKWDTYADYLITHARWLLGGSDPDQAFVTVARDGQDAVVTLELDPDRPSPSSTESPTLRVVQPSDERQPSLAIPFEWQGSHTLQARFRLARTGTYRPLVELGPKSVVRGPAVTLPYSPEYVPRIGLPAGTEVLKSLAELTGGKQRVNPAELLADPPRAATTWSLLPWLFGLAIGLLMVEIAGRRLSLWEKLVEAAMPASQPATARGIPLPAKIPPISRGKPGGKAPAPIVPPPEPKRAEPAAPTPADVFAQAKSRAKRRL